MASGPARLRLPRVEIFFPLFSTSYGIPGFSDPCDCQELNDARWFLASRDAVVAERRRGARGQRENLKGSDSMTRSLVRVGLRMSRAVPSGRREGMFPDRCSQIFGLSERLGCILNLSHSFDAIEA